MGQSKYDLIFTEKDKEIIRDDYVKNWLSIRDIMSKYNIKSKCYIEKILNGVIRNYSESNKIAHKRYPEKYQHSEDTKKHLREKRLEYIKNNPDKTAWRLKNQSYPEKIFEKFLNEKGYADKFLIQREYSVFPYFIDFAFIDLKIAIEIDGSQHILEERKKRDNKKDLLLQEKGWKVIRIAEHIVKTDWELLTEKLNHFIIDDNINFERVGIIKAPKKREKVQRNKDGRSEKEIERAFKQRKVVNRPSKEVLLSEIKEYSFYFLGKKYGVTDNTIRKWCKSYKLPYRKKDLK